MRFLAVYSISPFQVDCTISEESSRNSEKNQKIFSSDVLLQIVQTSQKRRRYALSNTLHRFLQTEQRNTFFHFFIKAESEYALFFGFYKNPSQCEGFVMGNSIKREGERQKHPRYIIVSRMFRFLSPTKLNRYEQAVYSAAHTIQPLCLAGVGNLFHTPALRL